MKIAGNDLTCAAAPKKIDGLRKQSPHWAGT
jgi:hypothetical protein